MLPLAKNIRRYFSLKAVIIGLLAIAVTVSVGVAFFHTFSKEVVIDNNGNRLTVKTMRTTVKDVLEQSGIEVCDFDYVNLPLNTKLLRNKTNTIHIKSAVPINVFADGKETVVMTCKDTVKEALLYSPVKLGPDDRIELAKPDDKIYKDMKVRVVRVRQELVSQNEVINRSVLRKENNAMDKGVEKVVSEGKDGIRENLYMVVYEDDRQVKKQLLGNTIISNPEKKIIECGTVLTYVSSRGDAFRYKKVMEMSSTAYTASFKDTGKHPDHPEFGITYTGVRAKRGIVAVDPRVIPLGTRLYIEGVGNVPDYGFAVAADIGSAIKGNKIDLYMDGQDVVDRWGRKPVRVYILRD